MLDYSEEAVEMCSERIQPGEQVKVIKGPLTGLTGELITMGGKSKVAVRIHILGSRDGRSTGRDLVERI